jgi:3-oxoacyl-[acyl-carrier-protein] synthase-1
VTPLGFDPEHNFRALASGKTGLGIQHFPFSDNPFCVSKIDSEELNNSFEKIGHPQEYTKLEKMSLIAVDRVLQKSGIRLSDKRTLLIFSTTKGNIDLLSAGQDNIPTDRVYLPALANVLRGFFKCAQAPLLLSNACISGLLALLVAGRMIRSGEYDHVVVAGADILSEFTLSGFQSFNALSGMPCRPYDANRNGINLGEAGAAVLLTNSKLHAGHMPIFLAGGASANDANHISGPSRTGEGLFRAVNQVIHQTGRSKPDFVSAHGTATEFNDEMESIVFSRVGMSEVPLHSLKGYYGHTLGAAGLVETIVGFQSLRNNTLIASPGYLQNGVSHTLQVITATVEKKLNNFLKTASGFGGCNAAALFEKEEEI